MRGFPVQWLSVRRLAAFIVLGLSLWLLKSFFVPIIWATLLAAANWPLYVRSRRAMPKGLRAHFAPLIFSALLTVTILGTVIFGFGVVAGQAGAWAARLLAMDQRGLTAPAWLKDMPLSGERLAEYWNSALGSPGALAAWLKHADSGMLLRSVQSMGEFAAYHALVVAVTIVVLFSLFRQGESLETLVSGGIQSRFGEAGKRYADIAVATLRGTVNSMVLVGLVDGIVMGIAYACVHVPSAAAWGAVTGIAAMLPFVGYVAVAAVCAALLAQGAAPSALPIGILGLAVLFACDKFLRPTLMAGGTQLTVLEALLGTIGGLQAFGLLGVFIGPVIIALGGAILREWLDASSG